jgi:hypothetical protein
MLTESYVKTIVNRYKDSKAIMAWELVNEARCLGELPAGPNCVAGSDTLHIWYKEQSDFIRKLLVFTNTVTEVADIPCHQGPIPLNHDRRRGPLLLEKTPLLVRSY